MFSVSTMWLGQDHNLSAFHFDFSSASYDLGSTSISLNLYTLIIKRREKRVT